MALERNTEILHNFLKVMSHTRWSTIYFAEINRKRIDRNAQKDTHCIVEYWSLLNSSTCSPCLPNDFCSPKKCLPCSPYEKVFALFAQRKNVCPTKKCSPNEKMFTLFVQRKNCLPYKKNILPTEKLFALQTAVH